MTFTPINSIYIHIPFCLSKCHYCDFFSVPCNKKDNSNIPQKYVDAILREIEYKAKKYNLSSIKTIYIGGGTPSLLTSEQLNQITDKINQIFSLEPGYEFTIEVNPDDVSKQFLLNLAKSPVNRISCGIQSLNQKVLKSVNRRAGKQENLNAIKLFSEYWNKKLSLDLIAALPDESDESFLEGLKTVCESKAEHISLYSLTIEDETELGQKCINGELNYDYDWADSMWLKGKEYLESRGFLQYEISNFSKQGKECAHNLTYWKHESYLGIGAGATGTVYKEDGSGIRKSNVNDIDEYIKKWTCNYDTDSFNEDDFVQVEEIDLETSKFEFFMMGLRKNNGISKKDFEVKFDCEFPKKIHNLFLNWEEKKLARINTLIEDTNYALNEKGLLFLNAFLSELEV